MNKNKSGKMAGNLKRLLLIIGAAFLINAVVLILVGENVVEVYKTLLSGAFVGKWNIARTLRWMSPLLFTGLAAAVAFRGGMFNLGIDGQLYLGAFAAAWVGFTFTELPAAVLIILCMLAAAVAGGIWAMIAGFMKIKFGASEVVVTLMMNYIAKLFTEYLVLYPFYEPGNAADSKATANIADQARLTSLLSGSQVTSALIIGLIVTFVIYFCNTRTISGYEMKITGSNPKFARFSGIHVVKRQIQMMAVSGGIAGLCGAMEILGIHGRFVANFSSGLGFDGIVVALLCGNNPLFIPLGSLFMGAMTSGSTQLEVVGGIPRSMAAILMGIIIIMITIKKMPQIKAVFAGRRKKEGVQ